MAQKCYVGGFKSAEVLNSERPTLVAQMMRCLNVWRFGVYLNPPLHQSSMDVLPC